ncbi:MAG: NUDIX hydrolase [Candidatus Gracilibacteria bacterium]|nr:NUDIX hydrolase [Candidatus Gracilibacteria bacterium]
MNIENCWYRISVKALIYNKKGDFLLCKEKNGTWDLPGGGLDHNENPANCLKRELYEEMGLKIKSINNVPLYFITAHKPKSKTRPWISNICYKTELESLDFIASDECTEIGFFNIETAKRINSLVNVKELIKAMEKNGYK